MEIPNQSPEAMLIGLQKEIETGSKTPIEVLTRLSKTGFFLFHGSVTHSLGELTPQQAFKNILPDGSPAVFATTSPEVAIFKSIVTTVQNNMSEKAVSGWRSKEGKISFYITKNIADLLGDDSYQPKNSIYVLDKNKFVLEEERGYVSEQPVKILAEISVTKKDLPKDIEIK